MKGTQASLQEQAMEIEQLVRLAYAKLSEPFRGNMANRKHSPFQSKITA